MPFVNTISGKMAFGRPTRVAAASSSSIVSTGLVLHLDAGNPTSYSGTGTTWTDLSPSGKNATLGAGVYYNSADGGVLTFNGSSTGIATITSAQVMSDLTNNMTIEVWYKGNTINPRLLSTGVGSNGMCFGSYTTTPTKWKVTKYGVIDIYTGTVPQDTNTWHQAVLVYSSTAGTKVYIDGALSETYASSGNLVASSSDIITIGALESLYHRGDISIVRWYNKVLSDAEVLQNYNANIGRYKNPAATSNILIYYDPSNGYSYPGTGTSLLSLGASAFTATLTSTTYTKPYLSFNGTTSRVSVADNAGYEPGSSDFSIEAWIYWDATTGSSRCVVSKTDNGGLASGWSYGIRTSTDGGVYFEVGNGTTSIGTAAYTVNPGQWYQVVGVWTNVGTKAMELYVNGAQQSTRSHSFTSIKNSTNALCLGTYNAGEYSQWFAGRIGVYRHYSKALSAAEVLQNYNNDRGLYGI